MLRDTTGGFAFVTIYGFEEPYRELAAAVIVRAVKDVRSGRPCSVDGSPCGTVNMVGVHVCARDAREFLLGEDAELIMGALGLNRIAVLEAIGVI